MIGITKEVIKRDYETVADILSRYGNAVWENCENQESHYNNQPKLVRLQIEDVRVGLYVAKTALKILMDQGLVIE